METKAESTHRLEYLGEGTIEVTGVGTFGRERFDRERKEWIRITILPCTEQIAEQLAGDLRFTIHRNRGLEGRIAIRPYETKKKKEV